MALKGKDNPYDAFDIPAEAPPSYDDVAVNASSSRRPDPGASGSSVRRSSIEKPRIDQSDAVSTSYVGGSTFRSSHLLSTAQPGPSRQDRVVSVAPSPKVQSDIRETVRGLVRNIIQGYTSGRISSPEALGILDSCDAACMKHSLSLAEILQERNIEGRSAVYWSIVSRSAGEEECAEGCDGKKCVFLLELLSYAAPLTPPGVSELRAACLAVSDNKLLQRLRSVSGLIPLSGTDRMLLVGSHPTSGDASISELERRDARGKGREDVYAFDDLAEVSEGGAGAGTETDTFRVQLQLRMFQRRMRVSGGVVIEFIALGRLWLLVFFIVPNFSNLASPSPSASASTNTSARLSGPSAATVVTSSDTVPRAALEAARARKLTSGTWAVALGLLEGSVQCYAEARIVITEHRDSLTPGQDLLSFREDEENSGSGSGTKLKPPIVLNLTATGSSPLLPLLPSDDVASPSEINTYQRSRRGSARARGRRRVNETWEDPGRSKLVEKVLLAGLENSSTLGMPGSMARIVSGRELMYDGCHYISPDGTLHAVLDARITSSPSVTKLSDCVIC